MRNKLRKNLFLTGSLIAVLALAACTSETTTTEEIKNDEKTAEVSKETGKSKVDKKADKEVKKEVVVYDEAGLKITYIGSKFKEDGLFGDTIEYKFDVKNDLERDVEVQAENISADGRMIDDMNYSMSTSIAAGKIGTATLTLEDYEGTLPEEINELELTLNVFDWDDYDFEKEIPVKIQTK